MTIDRCALTSAVAIRVRTSPEVYSPRSQSLKRLFRLKLAGGEFVCVTWLTSVEDDVELIATVCLSFGSIRLIRLEQDDNVTGLEVIKSDKRFDGATGFYPIAVAAYTVETLRLDLKKKDSIQKLREHLQCPIDTLIAGNLSNFRTTYSKENRTTDSGVLGVIGDTARRILEDSPLGKFMFSILDLQALVSELEIDISESVEIQNAVASNEKIISELKRNGLGFNFCEISDVSNWFDIQQGLIAGNIIRTLFGMEDETANGNTKREILAKMENQAVPGHGKIWLAEQLCKKGTPRPLDEDLSTVNSFIRLSGKTIVSSFSCCSQGKDKECVSNATSADEISSKNNEYDKFKEKWNTATDDVGFNNIDYDKFKEKWHAGYNVPFGPSRRVTWHNHAEQTWHVFSQNATKHSYTPGLHDFVFFYEQYELTPADKIDKDKPVVDCNSMCDEDATGIVTKRHYEPQGRIMLRELYSIITDGWDSCDTSFKSHACYDENGLPKFIR